MITDKINKWLNGSQNFIIGRVLFNLYGDDERINNLLKQGETSTTKKILRDALEKIIAQPVITEKKVNNITDAMPDASDAVLNALANEWKPVYAQMNYLRASLDKFGNSNAPDAIEFRQDAAFEILELEKQCVLIWAKRDHYLQHGSLPDVQIEEAKKIEDPVALAAKINSIKKNIRTNRQKMMKPGADAKFAQLYQQYKNEFKAITGEDYKENIKA